jgi:hypothetical protein
MTYVPLPVAAEANAVKVVETGYEAAAVEIGGASPNAPGVVALTGVSGFADWKELAIEATLAGTDGTGMGGSLQTWVQCSSDGAVWTDWMMLHNTSSGSAAHHYRHSMERNVGSTEVGHGLTPTLSPAGATSGGHPGEWLRVIFDAAAGTNHGVMQVVTVVGVRPKT